MKTNRKKGFTLVELLAVIVVIAIIIAIIMISSTVISKKSKDKAYESKKDIIVKSAELYGDDHKDVYGQCIIVNDLVKNGYLKYDEKVGVETKVINPKNNKSMNNEIICYDGKGNATLIIDIFDLFEKYIKPAAKDFIDASGNSGYAGKCITIQQLIDGNYLRLGDLPSDIAARIRKIANRYVCFDSSKKPYIPQCEKRNNCPNTCKNDSSKCPKGNDNDDDDNDDENSCFKDAECLKAYVDELIKEAGDEYFENAQDKETCVTVQTLMTTGDPVYLDITNEHNAVKAAINARLNEPVCYGPTSYIPECVEKKTCDLPCTRTKCPPKTCTDPNGCENSCFKDANCLYKYIKKLIYRAARKYFRRVGKTNCVTVQQLINSRDLDLSKEEDVVKTAINQRLNEKICPRKNTNDDDDDDDDENYVCTPICETTGNCPANCTPDTCPCSDGSGSGGGSGGGGSGGGNTNYGTVECKITIDGKTRENEWKPSKELKVIITNTKNVSLINSWTDISSSATTRTVTERKTYTFKMRKPDNSEVTCSAEIQKVDPTAPIIKFTTTGTGGDTVYSQTKNISPAVVQDPESGLAGNTSIQYGWSKSRNVAPTKYKSAEISYLPPTTSEVAININEKNDDANNILDGEYYLWIRATSLKNMAGVPNNGTAIVSTGTYKFDKSAPQTCNILYKNNDKDDWKQSKILIPQDSTDLHSNPVQYKWDEGSWNTAKQQIEVNNNNEIHTLYVKDSLGNTRNCSEEVTKIDTSEPTFSYSPAGDDEYTKAKEVLVYVQDLQSGIASGAKVEYAWGTNRTTAPASSEWKTAYANSYTAGTTGTVTIKITGSNITGNYYLWMKPVITNTAGKIYNTQTVSTNAFKFDNQGPTCTITGPTKKTNVGYLTVTANDDKSGLSPTPYSFNGTDYTTNNKYEIRADGTYTAYVKDYLENVGTCEIKIENIIDTTLPTITVVTPGNSTWKKTHKAQVKISDPGSGLADGIAIRYGLSFSNSDSDVELYEYDLTNYVGQTEKTFEVEFGNEDEDISGEYYLWVFANLEDAANNVAEVSAVSQNKFYLDNTPPDVTYEPYGNSTWQQSQSTKVTVEDAHSGNNILKYAWSTSNTTAPTFNTTFTSGQTITKNNGTDGYYLWIYVEDKLGNKAEIPSRSDVFNVDNTIPQCAWGNWNGTTDETIIKNGETATIKLTCVDNHAGITMDLTKNDITVSNSNLGTIDSITKATGATAGTVEYTITFKAGTSATGKPTLTLPANTIKDTANNYAETKTSGKITVDNSPPVCSWGSWSNAIRRNGQTATITLTCEDTNSGIPDTPKAATLSDPTAGTISAATVGGTAASRTYTYTFTAANVTKTTTVIMPENSVVDNAGNKEANVRNSSAVTGGTMIVDNSAPVCSWGSWSNAIRRNGQKATITLTCEDTNSGIPDTPKAATLSDPTAGTISAATVGGTAASRTYTYTFTAANVTTTTTVIMAKNSVVDNAGNKETNARDSSSVTGGTMTVDNSKPVCDWGHWSNDYLKSGETSTITLTCQDTNSGIPDTPVTVTLSDPTAGTISAATVGGDSTTRTYTYTFTAANVTKTTNVRYGYDNVYVVDNAGNRDDVTRVSSEIYVDNSVPVCDWGDWDKSYIKSGESATITLTCTEAGSGIAINLSNDDFTVNGTGLGSIKSVTKSGSETTRTYTVTFRAYESTGTTTITLPANKVQDRTGNKEANERTTSAIIIDNTPPTVDVSIADGETYTQSKTATINIKDTGGSGLVAGSYTIKYMWKDTSLQAPLCNDTDMTSITVPVVEGQNAGTPQSVTISNKTGAGNLYICNATTISDRAGNSLTSAVTSYAMNLDNEAPEVTFTPNSNTTYAKEQSTKVTVTEGIVQISELKYAWSTSNTTAPTFNNTFNSEDTIPAPSGETGKYYLWIYAKDTLGNTTQNVKSGAFYLDNSAPTGCSITYPDGDENEWKTSKKLRIGTATEVPSKNADNSNRAVYYAWNNNADSAYSTTKPADQTVTENIEYKLYVRDVLKNTDSCSVTPKKIDTTPPTASIELLSKTSSTIKVKATCGDAESSIVKYDFYLDSNTTPSATFPNSTQTTISGTQEYTYTGLTSGNHTVKVTCTNGAQNITTSAALPVTTFDLCTPDFTIPEGYAREKAFTINYNNGTSCGGDYLFKVTGSTTANIQAIPCTENSSTSYTCAGTPVSAGTSLAANTWYKVTSNPTLTYTSNGTIIAKSADGANEKAAGSVAIAGIDRTKPQDVTITNSSNGNWTKQNITIKMTADDNEAPELETKSGIDTFEYSYDGTNWTSEGIEMEYPPESESSYEVNASDISYTHNNQSTVSGALDDLYTKLGTNNNNSNNNTVTVPTGTLVIAFSTNSTLYVRAKDNAGNISQNNSTTTIKLDNAPPTCSIGVSTEVASKLELAANANDANGVGGIKYQWNDEWTQDDPAINKYSTASETNNSRYIYRNGTYKLSVTDSLGNVGYCEVNVSNIDDTSCSVNYVSKKLCRRAKTLHEGACTNSGKCQIYGYTDANNRKNSRIVYGNCGKFGELHAGDAFDCDVNGDGIYDENKERFYYVSKYFDTTNLSYTSETAVLISANNFLNGVVNNTKNSASTYGEERFNYPSVASRNLPYGSQNFAFYAYNWNASTLLNSSRKILDENNARVTAASFNGSRLLTLQELVSALDEIKEDYDYKYKYPFLLENTTFDYDNGNWYDGYFLETLGSDTGSGRQVKYVSPNNFEPNSFPSQTCLTCGQAVTNKAKTYVGGTRAALEVKTSDLEIYNDKNTQAVPNISLNKNSDTTPSKSKTITVTISDSTGLDSGGKFKWAISKSNTEKPINWYDITLTNARGEYSTTADINISGSGSGLFYLWIQPLTIKNIDGGRQTNTLVSSGAFMLDNEAPTCEISYDPSLYDPEFYNQGLELKITNITDNSENGYTRKFSWNGTDYSTVNAAGSNTTTNVTKNGTYTAYVKDYAGNIGTCSATIDNIIRFQKCSGTNCPVCKRATRLHSRICDGYGCKNNGYSTGDTITYGTLGNNTINSGDAFDCDVNGDGTYDANKERFYYVSNLWYNGSFNSNYGTLIASDNIYFDSNYNTFANRDLSYGSSGRSYLVSWSSSSSGIPNIASCSLPSKANHWSNVSLTNNSRNIYKNNGSTVNELSTFSTGTDFNYTRLGCANSNDGTRAARFLTYQELNQGCPYTSSTVTGYKLGSCNWLLENTAYDDYYNRDDEYWIESRSNSTYYAYTINGYHARLDYSAANSANASVRPVIEVSKDKIETILGAAAQISSKTEEGLVHDHANNLRYVGSSPNNYVKFNGNELWRILSVENNQLKIIKSTSVANRTYAAAVNAWSSSDVATYLNTSYYPSMNATSRNMIDETAKWNIGGTIPSNRAEVAYEQSLALTWTGKIGLMNMADYLYAGYDFNYPALCWNVPGNYASSCTNNWLRGNSEWTMTPKSNVTTEELYINQSDRIESGTVNFSQLAIRPVVYLKPEVIISGGAGTSTSPYELSMSDIKAPTVSNVDYIVGDSGNGPSIGINVTANDNIGIKKYTVYYGTSSSSLSSTKVVNTNSTNPFISIDNIPSGTKYYFKVCATDTSDNEGCSSISNKTIKAYYSYTSSSFVSTASRATASHAQSTNHAYTTTYTTTYYDAYAWIGAKGMGRLTLPLVQYCWHNGTADTGDYYAYKSTGTNMWRVPNGETTTIQYAANVNIAASVACEAAINGANVYYTPNIKAVWVYEGPGALKEKYWKVTAVNDKSTLNILNTGSILRGPSYIYNYETNTKLEFDKWIYTYTYWDVYNYSETYDTTSVAGRTYYTTEYELN